MPAIAPLPSITAAPPIEATRNFGLDVARTTAIAFVILAHFAKPLDGFGVFGVELFFVLSGYLIGGILHRQVFAASSADFGGLLRFWKRRWYRTMPNYYLFFFVSLCLAWRADEKLTLQIMSYLVFLQNFCWPITGFFEVSWSLAVEECFYLFFPLTLFLLRRRGVKTEFAFVLATGFFLLVPLGLRILFPMGASWDLQTRMVVIFRLDALMYGVVFAILKARTGWPWRHSGLLAVAGTLTLSGTVWMLSPALHPGGVPIAPSVLFALIPFGFALLIPGVEQWNRPRPLFAIPVQQMSEWSYSIYLCHIPVLFGFYALAHEESLGTVARFGVKALSLVAVLAVSRTLYRYFEMPLMRLRPRE
jgi:peptidoglycan/LPS O-acetylase OafA/YrhL